MTIFFCLYEQYYEIRISAIIGKITETGTGENMCENYLIVVQYP